MNELVSIVVPVYNCEKYLKRCIESLLGQTYPYIEIILVNDGSTDDSLKISKEYEEKYFHISVIDQKNQGVSVARNAGIHFSSGVYIGFVDSDDYVERDYVEKLVSGFSNGVDICICGHDIVRENKTIERCPKYNAFWNEKQIKYRLFMDTNFMGTWDKMYRKEFLLKWNVYFKDGLCMSEDALFEMHYALKCQSAYYIQEPLYHYMINYNSVTSIASLEKTLVERKKFWTYYQMMGENLGECEAFTKNAYELRKFYEALGIYWVCNGTKEIVPISVRDCLHKDAVKFLLSPHVKMRFKIKYLVSLSGKLEYVKKRISKL